MEIRTLAEKKLSLSLVAFNHRLYIGSLFESQFSALGHSYLHFELNSQYSIVYPCTYSSLTSHCVSRSFVLRHHLSLSCAFLMLEWKYIPAFFCAMYQLVGTYTNSSLCLTEIATKQSTCCLPHVQIQFPGRADQYASAPDVRFRGARCALSSLRHVASAPFSRCRHFVLSRVFGVISERASSFCLSI